MAVQVAPKAQVFSLRAPLLQKGRMDTPLSIIDHLWLHLKVYAEGGENALHAHRSEDHAFIVLEGQATFYDKDGKTTVVNKHQGVMLPKGALYRFQSSGQTNLVMLRVGTGSNPYIRGSENERVGPDGRPLPGDSKANDPTNMGPPVPVPGLFFGPAG